MFLSGRFQPVLIREGPDVDPAGTARAGNFLRGEPDRRLMPPTIFPKPYRPLMIECCALTITQIIVL